MKGIPNPFRYDIYNKYNLYILSPKVESRLTAYDVVIIRVIFHVSNHYPIKTIDAVEFRQMVLWILLDYILE